MTKGYFWTATKVFCEVVVAGYGSAVWEAPNQHDQNFRYKILGFKIQDDGQLFLVIQEETLSYNQNS